MIDLSNIVGLSSGDITTALASFFQIPAVPAVLSVVMALALFPLINRGLRWLVMGPGIGGGEHWQDPVMGWGQGEYNDESFPSSFGVGYDSWQGNEGRVYIDGNEFAYSQATHGEMMEAGAAMGDYSHIERPWSDAETL